MKHRVSVLERSTKLCMDTVRFHFYLFFHPLDHHLYQFKILTKTQIYACMVCIYMSVRARSRVMHVYRDKESLKKFTSPFMLFHGFLELLHQFFISKTWRCSRKLRENMEIKGFLCDSIMVIRMQALEPSLPRQFHGNSPNLHRIRRSLFSYWLESFQ